ncbi:MAG: hypothetical protein II970_08025 [Paludibacteraceae bacterium]|nr:hypothetical protein [Paludibacteraceae bacterium]
MIGLFILGVSVSAMGKNEIFFQCAEVLECQYEVSGANISVVMFSAKNQHKNNKTLRIQQWLYMVIVDN